MKTVRFRTLPISRVIRCGFREKMNFNSSFPYCFTWMNYNTSGTITVVGIDTPIKFKLYINDVLIEDTGYYGSDIYQNDLDTYLTNNFFVQEAINNLTSKSFDIPLGGLDKVDLRMYAPLNGNYPVVELICDES